MHIFTDETFSEIEPKDFCIEKIPDDRGFIYIVKDTAFPGYIKIGRTYDAVKRLSQYNADKPFNTTEYLLISRQFEQSSIVETKILKALYKEFQPIAAKKEWFEDKHFARLKTVVEEAEEYFK